MVQMLLLLCTVLLLLYVPVIVCKRCMRVCHCITTVMGVMLLPPYAMLLLLYVAVILCKCCVSMCLLFYIMSLLVNVITTVM